jgi:hypothetical protein
MIDSLPPKLKFPRVRRQNRSLIELENRTIINLASAGVKAGKSSGTLGRSSGINFVHASEMCSWDNTEGLEAFINALAQDFPNRLYIWESTARGPNIWKQMWEEALQDPTHQRCVFSGWWSKDNQIIKDGTFDFEKYGEQPPSDVEAKKILEVKKRYGWQVTQEQLAWVRRKMDPTAKAEGDAPAEFSGTTLKIQEQPWTEDDAFQMTGSIFFQPENLTEVANKFSSGKFKTYSYSYGTEFHYLRIYPAHNARSVELKVWEEADEDGVYVVASDVAFGANEKNDRSAIQVLRCYADGVDQVAEYAWPLVNSRQFAWVIASLLAYYAGERAEVYNIVELNGPGEATWNELQRLKHDLQYGYNLKEVEDRGLRRVFSNVRNYIYTRSDSMGAGHNFQWQTTPRLKVTIMERLRDFVSNSMVRVRSMDTIEEMKWITRDGDTIEAEGAKKDDRVIALAIGIRAWEQSVRKRLVVQKKTRENEAMRRRLTIKDQATLFGNNMLDQFFAVRSRARRREAAVLRKQSWRGR